MELIYEAATVHREWHKADEVQISTLLSVKTGAVLKIVLIADRQRVIIQILKYRHFYLQQTVMAHAQKAKERGASLSAWQLHGGSKR